MPLFSQSMMLLTGDPTKEKNAALYAAGALGKLFVMPNDSLVMGVTGTKIFQLVKITSVTSYVVGGGCPLIWSDIIAHEVTTAVTNAGLAAGIGIDLTAPLANDYIFMQIRGKSRVFLKNAPTTAALATGATALIVNTAGQVDCIATGVTPALASFGKSIAASSGNELVALYIDVPLYI